MGATFVGSSGLHKLDARDPASLAPTTGSPDRPREKQAASRERPRYARTSTLDEA